MFQEENLKLVEALDQHGTKARPIIGNIFESTYLDRERYGLVGRIVNVNTDAIFSSIRSKALPIVTSLGESADGQLLNINADTAAGELAKKLEPLKIVFLNQSGGMMHPSTGLKMDAINLDQEYEALHTAFSASEKKGTLLKLMEIKSLLDTLPRSCSVAITSAQHLSKELFTDSGAGTLIRRGFKVQCLSIAELDFARLEKILIASHEIGDGAKTAAYLEWLSTQPQARVYVDEGYETAAIVLPMTNIDSITGAKSDFFYLDKFVSIKNGEVNHVPDNVWKMVRECHPSLFWRTPAKVASKSWYFEKCEGSMTIGSCSYFWYGIQDLNLADTLLRSIHESPHGNPLGKQLSSNSHSTLFTSKGSDVQQRRSVHAQPRRPAKVGLIGARGHTVRCSTRRGC